MNSTLGSVVPLAMFFMSVSWRVVFDHNMIKSIHIHISLEYAFAWIFPAQLLVAKNISALNVGSRNSGQKFQSRAHKCLSISILIFFLSSFKSFKLFRDLYLFWIFWGFSSFKSSKYFRDLYLFLIFIFSSFKSFNYLEIYIFFKYIWIFSCLDLESHFRQIHVIFRPTNIFHQSQGHKGL